MGALRPIRENERELINFLLQALQLNPTDFPVNDLVDEYENGKMGSISLGGNPDAYAGDLARVEYVDSDGTEVVITLTVDDAGRLLDLDFWKVDFTKLITYPTPDKVVIIQKMNQ